VSQPADMISIGFRHGFAFFGLILAASLLALAASSPSTAQRAPLSLMLPVKCEVGRTCLIQKLVDHDFAAGRRDYRCGTLTTDGHDGVDIRLRTMDDMRAGYAVVAAASGRVLRTRDGEPDVSSRNRPDLNGKDAGNGVVIDHGGGWETQYSHLRQGSVAVQPGQQIAAGQPLGLVGMSGNAEFPHLHFTVRRDGKAIDPFNSAAQGSGCSAAAPQTGIWTAEAARGLNYVPTAVISAGLASAVPPKLVADRRGEQNLTGRQAPVILWADVIGARRGDVQTFEITGPDGGLVHMQQAKIVDGGLSWFAYSGKRAPGAGWAIGQYTGSYIIQRNGEVIVKEQIKSELK
jgi:Peptidase family M23